MQKKINLSDLRASKGRKKWLQVHVDTPAEAAAAQEAGIFILSCEPDHNLEGIRKAAPLAFVSAGMPHGTVASPAEALQYGFDTLRRGADAIYCSQSPFMIEAMAREGIPVTGHVGLVPNLAAWTGLRAIGRTAEEAVAVLRKAKDLENAGVACLEVEVIPVEIADYLTRSTQTITMGMGCGDVCDTQYLFSSDILGTNTGHYPRHSKRYADFAKIEQELQLQRIAAFRTFAKDVAQGTYPERKHEVRMDEQTFETFQNILQKF